MDTNELPDTPCQRWLASLNACQPAREWVGEKGIIEALDECDERDWLDWLAEVLDVDTREEDDIYWEATEPFCKARDQEIDRLWAERLPGEAGLAAYSEACQTGWDEYARRCKPADDAYIVAIKACLRPHLTLIAVEWETP